MSFDFRGKRKTRNIPDLDRPRDLIPISGQMRPGNMVHVLDFEFVHWII